MVQNLQEMVLGGDPTERSPRLQKLFTYDTQ